ncbi:hypothetical protein ACQ4LE_011181 [Meloidogyne hapla]
MNSTVWHTLTGFVVYLGKSEKCKIEENEKGSLNFIPFFQSKNFLGWYITYIDQEEELRKQKLHQRAKQEKDDEERMNEHLQRQIERFGIFGFLILGFLNYLNFDYSLIKICF